MQTSENFAGVTRQPWLELSESEVFWIGPEVLLQLVSDGHDGRVGIEDLAARLLGLSHDGELCCARDASSGVPIMLANSYLLHLRDVVFHFQKSYFLTNVVDHYG